MGKEKIRVAFLCVENARRSQMAQGFAEVLGKGRVEAWSAGSRPASSVDPMVIEVMKEKGIDLSNREPKGLEALPSDGIDYAITMGCEETCPALVARKVIEWQIPDPKGKSIQIFREVRDLIADKVRRLMKEMNNETRER
jgi:arsenate reductase